MAHTHVSCTYSIILLIYTRLSPLQPNPRPTLPSPRNSKPHTTRPTKRNTHPAMRRHLEHTQQHELHTTPRHINKRRTQRTRRLDQDQRTAKHGPAANRPAPDHQPEEWYIQKRDVVIYVPQLTGEENDGREERNGEERCIVQSPVVRARFLAIILLRGARRVSAQHVSCRN